MATQTPALTDLPLWRLLVLLSDAEMTVGPDSETARAIDGIIRQRMKQDCDPDAPIVAEGDRE
jgi:hypothetical protein